MTKDTRLRAGVFKHEISTNDEKRKVNDPLYAKALVIDDGMTKAVIIAMDAVAIGGICDIPDDFLEKLRCKISTRLVINKSNIMVNASHTHTVGPMLLKPKLLLDKTIDAVKRAFLNMEPVMVGSGIGYEDRIMINRSLRLKNGKHWTIRQANPCPPDEEVESLGPVDPSIGILRIDKMNGKSLAVVYNFSCHPLLGVPDGSVTANFPGYASKVIEQNLDTTAIFLQGACGDVTEVLYKDVNRPMDSKPVGRILGLSTLKQLKKIKSKDGSLSVVQDTVMLPRRTDIPERIEKLYKEQNELLNSLRFTSLNFRSFLPLYIKYSLNPDYPSDYSYRYMHDKKTGLNSLDDLDAKNKERIKKYLNNVRAMEKLARIQDKIATLRRHQKINADSGEDTVKAEIQGMKIGDFVMITAPFEMLTKVGMNVKQASKYKKTFIVSPTNGYIHYGPPQEYYDKGGYEVTECLLGSKWQRIYEQKAKEIIKQL